MGQFSNRKDKQRLGSQTLTLISDRYAIMLANRFAKQLTEYRWKGMETLMEEPQEPEVRDQIPQTQHCVSYTGGHKGSVRPFKDASSSWGNMANTQNG